MTATSESIVNVTMVNAQQVLIEASMERPVLVDFWADWCEPCKVLMPILEKLATEYAGRFLLAKANADELGGIAGQLGVRSLPTLILMDKGQPVDGLVGAQSEQAIRELLDKYLPPAWEADFLEAQALLASGTPADAQKARSLLRAALDAGGDFRVAILLADTLVDDGRLDDAEALLEKVALQDRQSDWQQVSAKLTLKREAGKAPEVVALEAAYAENPDDLGLAQQLAVALSEHQYREEALALLMGILRKDLNAGDGAIKKTLQDILAALGKGDPLAVQYQRQLYTLLY
ncbi:co-chaperone YbbN [Simiduia sp. 21SJ11W-1]|uniref:thioredoxin family protein n=1 Tax=Simiduia sp. 21SJ11W-1 TaxID=2909669 RepID=UPI00209D0B67|nr:co-chaperone YbbN [Simiduia sp. 21SJ11W-1]UTA46325.1 co-chaperone YbbN [Simiduia sp. 21SJ11W-1]